MRGQSHVHAVIDVEPLGVMVHLLGQQRAPRHESKSRAEIREFKAFLNRITVIHSRPAGKLRERCGFFFARKFFYHFLFLRLVYNDANFSFGNNFKITDGKQGSGVLEKPLIITYTTPPTLEDIEAVAESVFDALPRALRKHITKLQILVEEFPDDSVQQELEVENPFELLGLYRGTLRAPGAKAINNYPDELFLYRRPILDGWCETGDDLVNIVRRVVLQETAFHFGYTEDDIESWEEEMTAGQVIAC